MAGQVEVQPVVAERRGLQAAVVRARRRPARRRASAGGPLRGPPPGVAEVLERMPEDHRRRLPSPSTSSIGGPEVGMPRIRARARSPSRPRSFERVDQGSFAGAHVEDRSGRGDLVDCAGEQAAGAAEDRVADEAEPPLRPRASTSRRRPRRARPGRASDRWSRRRSRRRSAGRGAPARRRAARRTRRRPWRPASVDANGRFRQIAQTSRASSRSSSRSSKSSAVDAGGPRVVVPAEAAEHRVVEALLRLHRNQPAEAQRVEAEQPVERRPFLVEDLHVPRGAEDARDSTSLEARAQSSRSSSASNSMKW